MLEAEETGGEEERTEAQRSIKKNRRRVVTEHVEGRWREMKSRNGGENMLLDCRREKIHRRIEGRRERELHNLIYLEKCNIPEKK